MPSRNEDFDAVLKSLGEIDKALAALVKEAGMLDREASAAEATLKDEVAKRNIRTTRELADAIRAAVASGWDRVRTIEAEQRRQKDKFDYIVGGGRGR